MGHRDRPAPTHPHADGQRHERPALTATPAAPSTTPPTLPSATATRTATVAPAARATTKWTTTPIAPTATACTLAFGDMPPGQPFYVFVCCLACRGIISGYSCGGPGEPCPGVYFHPGAEVTRGQMSKFIANAAGYTDGIPSTQQTFTDVPPDQPFWLFVERAARHGVISGYACGGPGEPCDPQFRPYFRPAASLTRGQAAKFVANAAGFQEPVSSTQQPHRQCRLP